MRRPDLTAAEVEEMKAQEAAGMNRVEIARAKGIDPSLVTRHLGTRRKYVYKRTAPLPEQPAPSSLSG